jgi:membrane fusion protein (multidrug efflux system)
MRRFRRDFSREATQVFVRDDHSAMDETAGDELAEIDDRAVEQSRGGAGAISIPWIPPAEYGGDPHPALRAPRASAHHAVPGASSSQGSMSRDASQRSQRQALRSAPAQSALRAPELVAPARVVAPAELMIPVYPLVRRLALQQTLPAADRVLRAGLAELTHASGCLMWYVTANRTPFSLDPASAATAEFEPLVKRAIDSARAEIYGAVLVVPIVAAGAVVAVALLGSHDAHSELSATEQLLAVVAAQEVAGLLYQLLAGHAQAQRTRAEEAASLYRPEVLAGQRARRSAGELVHLSPRWLRLAYPAALLTTAASFAFVVLARAPTYSAGAGVVTTDGVEVNTSVPASVAAIRVHAGQAVRAGSELVRFVAQEEESAFKQADREYRNALATLLFDGADASSKAAVAAAAAARRRARDRLDARVLRSPVDGIVGDVRVRPGVALAPGDHVLTLLRNDVEPTVMVFLPGKDRPRLRVGQPLQIDLDGYTKVRERAIITEVGAEIIGPAEARRSLGQKNADAVPLEGALVMVRAKLPSRTFTDGRKQLRYHDGMPLRGEVKVENQPFLFTLFPALSRLF